MDGRPARLSLNSGNSQGEDMFNTLTIRANYFYQLRFPIVFLLLCIVIPALVFSGLKVSWKNEWREFKLGFWKKVILGILGGLAGEITAFAVFFLAESNWCKDMNSQGSHCDGQGPLVLILTVPLCGMIGSCASMLWTWVSIAIPANKPWASVFSYSGGNRAPNIGSTVAVQALYWAIFALAVYHLTRNLL